MTSDPDKISQFEGLYSFVAEKEPENTRLKVDSQNGSSPAFCFSSPSSVNYRPIINL